MSAGRAAFADAARVAAASAAAFVFIALAGCSSLPFGRDDAAASADASSLPAPTVTLYDFDVDAPGTLKALLLDNLDVARFRTAPRNDAITPSELARLAAATPTQARSLLETEGYFDADVKITQTTSAQADGSTLPKLVLSVAPGPRVEVKHVDVASTAPLAPRTPTRDEPWSDRLQHVRDTWLLPAGQPFRQSAWTTAKNAALGQLRADGYPKAEWQSTEARIDAVDLSAALSVTVESGPLFRIGELRIEGVHRYDVDTVRRLATFRAGEPFSEHKLLDYQDRIIKSGLFEGASVELDASGTPDAAPVTVKVKELTQHQATFGVGFSANTGPRVSVEHYDRKVFGWPWISHSTLQFGPNLKSLGTELTSYPNDDLWRNLIAANVEQLKAADETRDSWTARVGRSQDTTTYERLVYAEVSHSRVQSAPLTTSSDAASLNYNWLRRDVDNILLPTDGTALSLQGGAGYGKGTLARSDVAGTVDSKGSFARAYTRFNWFQRFASWYANGRVEGGQVFVHDFFAVPDTILFRAGGDNSVRGYGYRTLGPTVNGAVVGGRVLFTSNIELEHRLTDRLPDLLGAVFVDVGNAADRWNELRPVVGIGVGAHYRSPVGPLRIDIGYGENTRRFRLHLSVGVTF